MFLRGITVAAVALLMVGIERHHSAGSFDHLFEESVSSQLDACVDQYAAWRDSGLPSSDNLTLAENSFRCEVEIFVLKTTDVDNYQEWIVGVIASSDWHLDRRYLSHKNDCYSYQNHRFKPTLPLPEYSSGRMFDFQFRTDCNRYGDSMVRMNLLLSYEPVPPQISTTVPDIVF